MNEKAAQRRLVAPEAVGETFAAMLLPGFEIDVAVVGQGSDEIIAVADRAFGEFLRARGVQRDFAQRSVSIVAAIDYPPLASALPRPSAF